jgi:hypothetical protein
MRAISIDSWYECEPHIGGYVGTSRYLHIFFTGYELVFIALYPAHGDRLYHAMNANRVCQFLPGSLREKVERG